VEFHAVTSITPQEWLKRERTSELFVKTEYKNAFEQLYKSHNVLNPENKKLRYDQIKRYCKKEI